MARADELLRDMLVVVRGAKLHEKHAKIVGEATAYLAGVGAERPKARVIVPSAPAKPAPVVEPAPAPAGKLTAAEFLAAKAARNTTPE